MGASAMMALSQGIVTETFDARERGKALGLTGTTVAIGSLVGPTLGGILLHFYSWKSIFLINIPIGIIGAVLTFIIIPESKVAKESKTFDFKGSGMFVVSILLLFISLLLLQEGSITTIIFIPVFLLSFVIIFIFVNYERKINYPLVDLKLFKIKVFSFGISSAFFLLLR